MDLKKSVTKAFIKSSRFDIDSMAIEKYLSFLDSVDSFYMIYRFYRYN